jgi:hypothetical protein
VHTERLDCSAIGQLRQHTTVSERGGDIIGNGLIVGEIGRTLARDVGGELRIWKLVVRDELEFRTARSSISPRCLRSARQLKMFRLQCASLACTTLPCQYAAVDTEARTSTLKELRHFWYRQILSHSRVPCSTSMGTRSSPALA